MKIKTIKTSIFKEGDDLLAFIVRYIPRAKEDSVIVITSKIVALSERRTIILKSEKEREALIKKESQFAIKTDFPNVWMTIRDGMIMANAGIDESNANWKTILLPKDSYKTASSLRKKLIKQYGVKNLGILITDSRLLPLRAGVAGVSIGYAGFRGIRDYRGKPDIFGRKLKMTRTDVADGLATAAVLFMGEGNERQPLALITDAPIVFARKVDKKELLISVQDDIYTPLFRKSPKK
jgi:coenzyme F420-0:L-glutamate ligase